MTTWLDQFAFGATFLFAFDFVRLRLGARLVVVLNTHALDGSRD